MDAAVARVLNPNWMPEPDRWLWRRPDGAHQGFGPHWREHVGLSNLLWLATGLKEPPKVFDASSLELYMLIMLHASGYLRGLVELAEVCDLARFSQQLGAHKQLATVPGRALAPLFIVLANERVRHATVGQ